MTELTSRAPTPSDAASGRNVGFFAMWAIFILIVVVLPLIFRSGGSHTTFSLIGIAAIFALSYNILLGQTGLLSFGHAVYYGLGGFLAVHGMNAIAAHGLPVPLPFVPLIGGFAGLVFAIIIGWVSTQRAGTVFAMISLGIGELVASSSLILRSFFGGEAGITTNRTELPALFGFNFGPQIQVYYLIGFWLIISAIAMYALTRTPLGRMCNAVRDNPERVQFIGYDPHVVRYLSFCFAGFFAGIAGALAAINFEIANAAYLGAIQSGVVLFAAFIGGVGYFFGPILGAVVVTMLQLELSDITTVWQLYFGIIFIGIVMFAPGGLASLLMMHRPLVRAGTLPMIIPAYLVAIVPTVLFACGVILVIEILAAYSQGNAGSSTIRLFLIPFEAANPTTWLAAAVLTIGGFIVARMTWRGVTAAWDRAMTAARERGYHA